jgi:hypothetical protein
MKQMFDNTSAYRLPPKLHYQNQIQLESKEWESSTATYWRMER